MEKKLKIILCTVIIILIAVISFGGIYSKDGAVFKSNLPKYSLASDLKEKRLTQFIPSEGTEEIIYDKDGKEVDEVPEGANEADYKKENKKLNADEILTSENYKKAKKIFDARLKDLKIENYTVRVDENTGKTAIELEENLDADTVLQYILGKGDFSIADSESKEVLLDKSNVKEAKVLYSNASSSGITVYLDIVFDKEGKQKLLDISREYKKIEENTDNNEDSENEEKKEETKQKQVTLTVNGTPMLTTYFGEEMPNGELPISLGSGTDQETLSSYARQGQYYAMLINNPDMPISYEMEHTKITYGNLEKEGKEVIILTTAVISAIIIVYMIIRFKVDGLIAGITEISVLAMLLLMVRYTGAKITLNSISAISIILIVNAYLISKMLKKIKEDNSYESVRKWTLKTYIENIEVIIVSLIIAIIFTFMKEVQAFSFGMTLFYGIISVGISNLIFLRTMLLAKYSNK